MGLAFDGSRRFTFCALSIALIACGNSDEGTGGAGGAGASMAASGGNASSSSSTTNGAGGAGGGCSPVDCAIDSLCSEGVCGPNDECLTVPFPSGTSCGDGGANCDGQGNCQLGQGAPCGGPTECLSGFCTDGLCCDAACGEACSTCAATGSEGTCTPYASGTDPELECGVGTCSGGPSCANGGTVWASRFGDAAADYANDVAVDSTGNVVVAGYYQQQINFGGANLNSAGSYDAVIAKLDQTGTHVWSKRYGDALYQDVRAVAVDGNDDIIVAGSFEGSIDLGGGALTSAGDRDVFVAKLDAAGNHIFSAHFGDLADQRPTALAVGPNGQIAMVGYFEGTIDFGGSTLTSAGNEDWFVAVFDAAGNHAWSHAFGSASVDLALAAAFDSAGNLYVGGEVWGAVDFGGGALSHVDGADAALVKFSASGNHLWSQAYGGTATQSLRAIAVDSADNPVVQGNASVSVAVGGGPTLTVFGSTEMFMAKLTPNGSHVWSDIYQSGQAATASGIAVDANDDILVGADGIGTLDLGGGPLPHVDSTDVFLAKLTSGGVHVWSHAYGGTSQQRLRGLAVDATGHTVVVGPFRNTMGFGAGGMLSSAGSQDVYVARITP